SFLFVLLGILWFFSPIKKFDGQIFLLYLMSYAAGRSVLEIFRGDEERGLLLNGLLSHSQVIGAVVVLSAALLYRKWQRSEPN
ncbi:MAG: prolipoprotein diacylglyceryl transferase, partial [Cyclobacteriaceae bacterium]|nr:prolipoprotein diacylglyceryl transferase [Cyclobacteriaceae bacterium]